MRHGILPALAGLLVASAVSAQADDIPGDPGTKVVLRVGATLDGALESATDADWLRTSLRAGQLYAFTFSTGDAAGGESILFRLSARNAAGRVLAAADLPTRGDSEIVQLNFRPRAAGTHFLEVKAVGSRAAYQVGLFRDVSSSFKDAARLPFGTEVAGTRESNRDTDYYVVRLEKGKPVDVLSPGSGPAGSSSVVLYDRERKPLDIVDDRFGKLAYHVPTYTGDHFVSVNAPFPGRYTLKVAPADRGRPTPDSDLLIGTDGPDTIDALGGDDLVRGLAGDDVLRGGPGDNTIFGGPGRDRVSGAETIDRLFGEEGDDVLTGGPGADDLDGGPGKDRFRFFGNAASGYDSGSRSNPDLYQRDLDRVRDFAAGDKIDLRGMDADAIRAGRQRFRFVGAAPFSGPGQVRYRFYMEDTSPRTVIGLNTDVDMAPEMEIQLEDRVALRAKDFILRDRPRRR